MKQSKWVLLIIFLISVSSLETTETNPQIVGAGCDSNCAQCNSDQTSCTKCKDTFTLSSGSCSCTTSTYNINGTCVSCDITNCVACSSINFCSQCSGTLVVNSQRNGCISCTVTNCELCSANNVCTLCSPGYTLNVDGFNTHCYNCSTIEGCGACSSDHTCSGCVSGYAFVDNKCVACEEPCLTCSATNVCITCMYGSIFY